MPGGCERSKMIQPNDVYVRQQGAQAVEAPAKACLVEGSSSCRQD
jgi:hypothetical protein